MCGSMHGSRSGGGPRPVTPWVVPRRASAVTSSEDGLSVFDAALHAAADLAASGASTAVVGGLAVSVRGEPRNTRDVDFAVSVADDSRAEEIVRWLASRSYGIVAVLEHETRGRLATVRLRRGKAPAVLVDLLFASSGIEREVVAEAEPIEIAPGVTLPVARAGHLIAMKVLSRDDVNRPQDRLDLASLLATSADEEIERARRACATIHARGYSRGRDLDAELNEALATWRANS